MPSSGKALLCNLISSLPKVDPWVMLHYIENIVALNKLGKIDNQTSEYLLKTNHNVFFHDSLLLRNSNFRRSDITSIQNNVKYKILKKRLDPNESNVLRKNKHKIITHYCLHFTAIAKEIIFKTFKNKLLYIQVLRSPITFSMIKRIADWTKEIEKSKNRDGHIKFFYKRLKKNIPYFMKDMTKEYFLANKYERAIMIIEKNFNTNILKNDKLKKYKSSEIVIPFENLIQNPKNYLNRICNHIQSKIDKNALKSFKKNNVPRYLDLKNEELLTLQFLKKKVQPKYYTKLLNLNNFYKRKILKKF